MHTKKHENVTISREKKNTTEIETLKNGKIWVISSKEF